MRSDYLSIADFAEKAGVSKQAVYKRVDKDLKQYVKLVDGKKALHINALTLFNTIESTEEVEQPKSVDLRDEFIEQLKLENSRLYNQLVEKDELINYTQEENSKLTSQLTKLSNDFSELAKQAQFLTSQAQSLQGHVQQKTLGQHKTEIDSTVETQFEKVEDEVEDIDKPIDTAKKKGFFAKLFG